MMNHDNKLVKRRVFRSIRNGHNESPALHYSIIAMIRNASPDIFIEYGKRIISDTKNFSYFDDGYALPVKLKNLKN